MVNGHWTWKTWWIAVVRDHAEIKIVQQVSSMSMSLLHCLAVTVKLTVTVFLFFFFSIHFLLLLFYCYSSSQYILFYKEIVCSDHLCPNQCYDHCQGHLHGITWHCAHLGSIRPPNILYTRASFIDKKDFVCQGQPSNVHLGSLS
jgi:hypothetical protein